MRTVHPIETESYRRLRAAVDTTGLPRYTRDVVERIIHTTADPGWLDDLVTDKAALAAGAAALAAGAPLVVDVTMVAAGISGYPTVCRLADARAADGLTRTAATEVGDGAVWVVGNAPTALDEVLRVARRPALVVGVPVGYVGAVEAKAALRATGLPQLSNRSARGGSAVAAAAVNALRYGDPLA